MITPPHSNNLEEFKFIKTSYNIRYYAFLIPIAFSFPLFSPISKETASPSCKVSIPASSNAELTKQEINYFNFFDFNKDEKISFDEITSTLNLIFKLIDLNLDGNISELEILELKNIIESLSWVFGVKL